MRHFDPYLDSLNKHFPRRQPEPPYKRSLLLDLVILLAIVIIVGFVATECDGQTISPVISEARGPRVRGEILLTNGQLVPLSLVLEPQSVSVALSGQPLYRALDSGIVVKLDSTSARLGPKQTYRVGYEIQCASLPCVVNLAAVFTGLHTKNGIAVAIRLPSILYVCEKAKGCRDKVRASWGLK